MYTLSLFGEDKSLNGGGSNKQTQKELVDFILEFHLENVFIYRCDAQASRSLDDKLTATS